jgi:hypothetical protein
MILTCRRFSKSSAASFFISEQFDAKHLIVSLGFKMGNLQVRFSHTIPSAYRTIILAVWFETHSTFGTCGYFSLK